MRTTEEIREELARATAERAELWSEAARSGGGAAAAEERARVTRRIEELWHELRAAEVYARSGPSEPIVRRARREQLLERAIAQRLKGRPSDRNAA